MVKQRKLKTVQEKSDKMIRVWDKKRAKFFATNPTCKKCGGVFEHMSRTMICRKCQTKQSPEQSKRYRKKYKKRIQAYAKQYYLDHTAELSEYKKYLYQKKKDAARHGKT
jgi:predicted Zn-ribbon and HTH transcriptional regulator